MKALSLPLLYLVLAILAPVAAVVSAEEIPEADLGAFHRPEQGEENGSFAAEEAKGVAGKIAQKATFERWKTFEDDRVKFSYPEDEAIIVEVKTGEPIPVDGNRVSSVDTSFSRAYRLVADGTTLTVLMLKDDAIWFDDGVCLCGEIVYERYLLRGGHFYRFGFLEDGVMKKMEVLGDKERLMMFEWTHSPIHEAVYRRIARSIELKGAAGWKASECRERVAKEYGPVAAVGWFDEGTAADDVVAQLGAPTKVLANGTRLWESQKEKDGYRWTESISLPFVDGRLARFSDDYQDSGWKSREVVKGGLPWMKEQAEPYERPLVRGQKAKEMPEDLKAELLKLFLEKAEDPNADFNGLCQVLKTLVEQGIRDPKSLDIVRKRFAAEGDHYAAWVLHEAGDPEGVTLFVEKVRATYKAGREDDFSDLHNWLAFIPDEDARYPDLLREGLNARDGSIRDTAYYFLDDAPFSEEERFAFVRLGLQDAQDQVRYWSAHFYEEHPMSDDDWKLLEEAAVQEKDESTRKKMDEIIKQRGAKRED